MAPLTARLPLPLPLSLALVAALTLLMAVVMPAAAAPTAGGATAGAVLSRHVANCDDITIAADGTISVNGVALTTAQAELLSADTRAALQLAANADGNANADVCVDVSASLIPLSVVANADIALCGSVALTATSSALGGVSIPAELLSAGLREALAIAAAANVNACLTTTVTNNSAVSTLTLDACVQARLNSAGDVVVTVGGQTFVLDGFVISGTTGALSTSAAISIALRIGAAVDLTTDAQTLTIQVVTLPGCAATPPSGGSTPGGGGSSPGTGTDATDGGGGAPDSTGSGAPIALLPDTAMEAGTLPVAIPVLALVALSVSALLAAARAREVRSR